MNEKSLNALCQLLMCDDPTRLEASFRQELEAFADSQAQNFGRATWVEFYIEGAK